MVSGQSVDMVSGQSVDTWSTAKFTIREADICRMKNAVSNVWSHSVDFCQVLIWKKTYNWKPRGESIRRVVSCHLQWKSDSALA